MTDALLAAVLADPDADLPRLVFADALDDAGDPLRAEFVRVQVSLARTPDDLALKTREQTLLALHAADWLAPLRAKGEPLQNPGTHGGFRRGFVEEVWMPAGVFLWKADKLFRRAPVRTLLVTRAAAGELGDLFHSPHLRRLRELAVSGPHGHRLATAVAEAGWLPPVLVLPNCGLTDADTEVLTGAARGWEPDVLDVSLNPLTAVGLAELRARFGAAVRFDR